MNTGRAPTNSSKAAINLHGVQIAEVSGNDVTASAPFRVVHTVGTPKTVLSENRFFATPEFVLEELNYDGAHRAEQSGNVFVGQEGKSE